MRNLQSAVLGMALLIRLFLPANTGSAQENQPLPSQDAIATGNGLLHSCTPMVRFFDGSLQLTHEELTSGFLCLGYISGFADGFAVGLEMEKSQTGSSHSLFCVPNNGLPASQGLRIVVKWLHEHPGRLHQPSGVLITLALEEAFPCK